VQSAHIPNEKIRHWPGTIDPAHPAATTPARTALSHGRGRNVFDVSVIQRRCRRSLAPLTHDPNELARLHLLAVSTSCMTSNPDVSGVFRSNSIN
jgi:hypothetical protein